MKQRILYYDIIRTLACLMVIMMHSPYEIPKGTPLENVPRIIASFLGACSYLTTPCVPLFFMLSGALLLPCGLDRPVFSYVNKCLKRLVCPILLFTIVSLYFGLNLDMINRPLLYRIISIPFSYQGHGVLWFLYVLVGLYLLVPIISPWLRQTSRRSIELYLSLWSVSLFYPYLERYVWLETSTAGILYYFSGYIGYFLLGYYLREYDISLKIMIPLTIVCIPLPVLNKYCGWNYDFYKAFWYLSAPVAIMSVTLFLTIKKIFIGKTLSGLTGKVVNIISNYSLGIYLIHVFIMRLIVWKLPLVLNISNYIVQSIVIFCLTLLITTFICWILSKLPFSQYVIGYKSDTPFFNINKRK